MVNVKVGLANIVRVRPHGPNLQGQGKHLILTIPFNLIQRRLDYSNQLCSPELYINQLEAIQKQFLVTINFLLVSIDEHFAMGGDLR